MSKERRAVSLDPEVDAYLARDEVNASGLVNDLVKRHMNGDAGAEALRDLRKRQLRSEVDSLENRAEKKLEELQKIEEIEDKEQSEQQKKLQEAIEKVGNAPRDPENPAIQTQAKKVGMDPEEFIDELPARDGGVDSL